MLPKRNSIKASSASHYWISLLTVLLPVMIFGVFIYIYNINANKNYIEQMRLSSFQQASTQIGYLIEVLKGIAGDCEISEQTQENEDSSIFLSLNEMEQKTPFPVNAFYYKRGDKYIYTASQMLLYQDFEAAYDSTYNLSRPQFFYRLNSEMTPKLLRFYLQNGVSAEGLIAFIYPTDSDSVLFFFFSENSLWDVVSDYFGEPQGELLIYNSSLDVILSSRPDNDEALNSSLLKLKGTGLLFLKDTRQVALRQTIGLNEMTIVNLMDQKDFYSPLTTDRLILSGLILLMFLCCLILLTYGIRQAGNALATSHENTRCLQEQVETQSSLLIEHFSQELINGHYRTAEELYRTAGYLGLTLKASAWIVMVIIPQKNTSAELPGVPFCSEGMISIAGKTPWYPGMFFLLNLEPSSPEDDRRKTLAARLQEFLLTCSYRDFTIGVSTFCRDPLLLKHAFYEAEAAALSSGEKDSGQILFYRMNREEILQSYTLPAVEKSLLTASIQRGEMQVAFSALDSLLDNIESTSKSFLLVHLMTGSIANLLLQLAQDYHLGLTQSDWTDLISFQSMDTFRSCVKALTEKLCLESIRQNRQQKEEEDNAVLTFIRSHYTKPDFSLDYAADTLKLSRTKVSAVVKEKLDLGFQQYITLLRMNEIKRQLTETGKSIQDIIRDVGYLDVSSSIRKFKSLEGVTPGQYRSMSSPKK